MPAAIPKKRGRPPKAKNIPPQAATPNPPVNKKAKILKPLQEELNSDDQVEEYHFDEDQSDGLDDDDESSDNLDDVRSVITVSSDPPDDTDFNLSARPWRYFAPEQRAQWEMMYANVATLPMDGSWEVTEDYQRERDREMLQYLEDFPLHNWVIPKEQAEQAYFHFMERTRWRSLGIRIYGREPVPDWVPGTATVGHAQAIPQTPTSREPYASIQSPQISRTDRVPLPPPPQVVPTQYHVHPVPVPPQDPNARDFPMGRPQQSVAVAMPGTYPAMSGLGNEVAFSTPPVAPRPRKKRAKKQPVLASSPPLALPTPPYPEFKKPEEQQIETTKPGRKNARHPVESGAFPWTRQMDFVAAKENATWDDSIYDPMTLTQMEATRVQNMPVIAQIDTKIIEQQRENMRLARAAKRRFADGEMTDATSSEPGRRKGGRKKDTGTTRADGHLASDPYHSGQFSFASADEEAQAQTLGVRTPDEIIDGIAAGRISLATSGGIRIYWNPGKRALAERNLVQAVFAVRDTVLTRRQLERTPILTRRAAERIIDFCPDLLWRHTLLRIASEAGYGNKDVRDRFCWNGCYCDKATITKRISAALGQKQAQAKSKGYAPGELEWYNHNVKNFSHYIDFFGKRTGHRNWTKILSHPDDERKMEEDDEDAEEGSSRMVSTLDGAADVGDDEDDEDGDYGDTDAADRTHSDEEDTGAGGERDVIEVATVSRPPAVSMVSNGGDLILHPKPKSRIKLEDADEEFEDGNETEDYIDEGDEDDDGSSVPDSIAADEMDEDDE